MSIVSVMPSNHLILCRPLLLPPSIFPSIRVFANESALCMRWPKYWSFSINISPCNEYPGLISFRMDWLDLLAVPRDSQKSSTKQQTYIYIYIFFFIFFPIMVYHWVLTVVPCAIQYELLFICSLYNSLHLLIPNSQFILPHSVSSLATTGLSSWSVSLFLSVDKFIVSYC